MRRTRLAIGIGMGLVVAGAAAMAAEAVKPNPDRSLLGIIIYNTTDFDKATAYYTMLGFQEYERRGEKPNRVAQFNFSGSKGTFVGGISLHEAAGPLTMGNAYVRTSFVVKDVRAVCNRLAEAKMPCTSEPRVVAGDDNAVIAMAKDPDGRIVELIQHP